MLLRVASENRDSAMLRLVESTCRPNASAGLYEPGPTPVCLRAARATGLASSRVPLPIWICDENDKQLSAMRKMVPIDGGAPLEDGHNIHLAKII